MGKSVNQQREFRQARKLSNLCVPHCQITKVCNYLIQHLDENLHSTLQRRDISVKVMVER